MIAYLLRQLTKSNILWFVLDLRPLKNPCANMDQNLFFQKCKQQYWDKLNAVKTPWVLVALASSKHIKQLKVHIVLHEPLSGLLGTVHWH